MKTMCPPGYHHNGFVATHALVHMMYGWSATVHHMPKCLSCHKTIVVIAGGHFVSMTIYIYTYIQLIKKWEQLQLALNNSKSEERQGDY